MTVNPFERRAQSAKRNYPPGTRIRLLSMSDPIAPVPDGATGTVDLVDDAGQIHMKWDNGRTLALIPGEDSFEVLSRPRPQRKAGDAR